MNRDDESIFDAALEITDAADRAAYLDRACAGDAALRAEVESLLAAYTAGVVLESPAVLPVAARDTTAYLPVAESVGTEVGPYTLREPLGEGGMGQVFVAEQRHPVRRKVALKVIKPGMDSRQVVARFEAERQALALMDHPNIARVLDAGTTAAGRPFFVMELVKGAAITDYCDANTLTVRDRLGLFLQVCRAVQHAHQKGVIHRDLKPSNVLVAVHDVAPVVKVIDFGIAKAVGPALTDNTVYTGVAQMVGTPLYMSPEQAGESSLDVDTRTDVYSLGVVLYELLTGTTPIDPEAFRKAGYDEVRRLVREGEPARPSARLSTLASVARSTIADRRRADPRRLADQLRGELDWVVMRCLEKDRDRRYESVSALAADVQRYLRDEPVTARPPSPAYRLRKFARRHRAGLTAGAAVVAVALLGGGGAAWQAWEATGARAAADEKTREAREKREGTEQLVGHLVRNDVAGHVGRKEWARAVEVLTRGQGLLHAAGGGEELLRSVEDQLRDARMALTLEELYSLPAEVTRKGPDVTVGRDRYRRAFRDYGTDVEALPAEEAGRQLAASAIRVELATALLDWADSLHADQPEQAKAREHLLAVAQAADPDPQRAQIRAALATGTPADLVRLARSGEVASLPAVTLRILGRALRDRDLYQESRDLLTRAQQKYPGDFWINYELTFTLFVSTPPRYDLAVGYSRAALAANPDSGMGYYFLGQTLYYTGDLDGAIDAYRAAFARNARHYAGYCNLANALKDRGRMEEALAVCHEATRFDPEAPVAWTVLGNVLHAAGRLDEAVDAHRKSIGVRRNFPAGWHNLGVSLAAKGEHAQAVTAFHRAIKLDGADPNWRVGLGKALFDADRFEEAAGVFREVIRLAPGLAIAHRNLGASLFHQEELDDAIPSLREAIRLGEPSASVRKYLGQALAGRGRHDEAVAAFREATRLPDADWSAYFELAKTLSAKGEYALAREAYREFARVYEGTLADLRAKHPPDHDDVLSVLAGLAGAYREAGEFDRARSLLEEVLRLRTAKLGPDHAVSVATESNLIKMCREAGRFDLAEQYLRARLDWARSRYGRDSLPTANVLADLGMALVDGRKYVEAEPVLRDCLRLRSEKQPDAWNTFNTRAMLGGALLGQGRHAEAEPLLREGYDGMKEREATIPPTGRARLPDAARRLAVLCEATGRADEAKTWWARVPPPVAPPPRAVSPTRP